MNSTASNLKRNVGLLAACQAMLFTNNSTLIAINGLAGLALAPYRGPCDADGDLLGAGRRARHDAGVDAHEARRPAGGLMSGTVWGIAGALLCGLAIYMQNFWLLCLGTLVLGRL